MKKNASYKLVVAIISILLVQLSCSILSGNTKESQSNAPPYYGVFILDGNNYIEIPRTEGMPASKDDEKIPSIANSDQELIIWYPDINLDYLYMREYGLLSGNRVDFNIAPIDDEIYKIFLKSNIDSGVYCLIQGDPLGSPYSLPTWCYRIGNAGNDANLNDGVQITTPSNNEQIETVSTPVQEINLELLFELEIPFSSNATGVIMAFDSILEWSPDGNYLIVLDDFGDLIYLIDIEKQEYTVINSYFNEEFNEQETPTYQVNDIAWSPDSKLIAIAGNPELRMFGELIPILDIIDLGTKSVIHSYENPHNKEERLKSALVQVDWSSELNLIATADKSGLVKAWNPLTGYDISAHGYYGKESFGSGILSSAIIDWAPDNKNLAIGSPSASADNYITVWDTQDISVMPLKISLNDFYGNSNLKNINLLKWNPDGKTITIVDSYWNAILYNTVTTDFNIIDPPDYWFNVDWHPNGEIIAMSGQKGTTIWSIDGTQKANFTSIPSVLLAWSKDGNFIATIPRDSGKLQIWKVINNIP